MSTSVTSYNQEKVVTGEVEYPATDPASGAIFQNDFKKNEDLKMMLDGSKDSLKLEAMKRIIGMIAKGRDASDLFPAVVKNVVSKNAEVKKLVYAYLVRYAEQQQDLALLSISTFQRALKEPNQLIRAGALRVLSSVRVPVIVPIVMLAIRDAAADMSPYVRKTAAHAIPKLYSLDPEQKEELVLVIEKLLSDKAPLVVGSAAMAFSELCPERLELLHAPYRKLCLLLVDVDEWGQCALLHALTVYARHHFPHPDQQQSSPSSESEGSRPFYSSSSGSEREGGEGGEGGGGEGRRRRRARSPSVDPDLRLLLRAAKPLLQSRSAAVVLAVATLYWYTAPASELAGAVKALVRLLRGATEVQSVVLDAIASLALQKPSLFVPYLKSFFVRQSDARHVKLLKLEVLTLLASEATAPALLQELQQYVAAPDRALAAAAVQAIGRTALAVESETQACLNASLQLLSSKHEWLVCEAVVVVKRVVGAGGGGARAAVTRAARLLRQDRLAPAARAAAVWLVAEHGVTHPRAAAVLAHMLRSYSEQDEVVKLQLLSLAAKLSLAQPGTEALARHACQLARYDASFDVRDRARLLAALLRPERRARARAVLLQAKPPPQPDNRYTERSGLRVGSLSHYVGAAAARYRPLPEPPRRALHAGLRAAAPPPPPPAAAAARRQGKNKSFYSEPESGAGSGSSSASGSDSSSEEDSSSGHESSDEENTKERQKREKSEKETNNHKSSSSGSSDSGSSSSDSESGSGSDSADSDAEDAAAAPPPGGRAPRPADNGTDKGGAGGAGGAVSNLELLLALDGGAALPTPTITPTQPAAAPPHRPPDSDEITPCAAWGRDAAGGAPAQTELLSRAAAGGLQVSVHWSREPHLAGGHLACAVLTLSNHSAEPIQDIRITHKALSGGRALEGAEPLGALAAGAAARRTVGLHLADSIQPVEFSIQCDRGSFPVVIKPAVGELCRAVTMSEARWCRERDLLRGMNECVREVPAAGVGAARGAGELVRRVLAAANLGVVSQAPRCCRFSGWTLSAQSLVLVSVELSGEGESAGEAAAGEGEGAVTVRAHCANVAIAALLAADVAAALASR